MAVSQNGYTANDRSVITKYVVSDSGRVMNLRKGSPGELLAHFVRWFDRTIRNIDPGIMDDWSYAEREIRGSTTVISNHASGTAADVDATKWPLGVDPSRYLTAPEIATVRAKLREYEGCIRWGGDYAGRKDPMHFEINKDFATCDRVWAKIKGQEEDDMYGDTDRIRDNDMAAKVGALAWILDPPGGEAQGELLTLVRGLHSRDPKLIVASIPDNIAQQVLDGLAAKLSKA